AQLARLAGAPLDRGAGIDMLKRIGDKVEAGEPLFRIYSAGEAHFNFAVEEAEQSNGFALASAGIPAKAFE
ncbi:MAG: thymidine phosphorylase, partial [Alphaproteobacteria bacterium HGW-Alphaproteobacteria-5]